MNSNTPASNWQKIILDGMHPSFRQSISGMSSAQLYQFLRTKCAEEKQVLKLASAENNKDRIAAHTLGLYVLSCLRLCSGDPEAVEDIVHHLPDKKYAVHTLSACLYALLPLPEETGRDATKVLDWVQSNRERLSWNMEKGQFELPGQQ